MPYVAQGGLILSWQTTLYLQGKHVWHLVQVLDDLMTLSICPEANFLMLTVFYPTLSRFWISTSWKLALKTNTSAKIPDCNKTSCGDLGWLSQASHDAWRHQSA